MSSYVRKKTTGNTDWFVRDRFGMIIHFGLYALPARHEWIKRRELIPEEAYQKYFEHFNPDLFDAREWARAAKRAGMKYAVLTTKHHEGFCLFDTKYTDYKITNTAFGRDLVAEFVEAFRAEGLKIGFYYSLLDWHHPDYPLDFNHPRRTDPDAEALDRGRDMTRYAAYMRDQVRELLTNYGKIDVLWFDFSFAPKWEQAPAWMQYGGGKLAEQWEADKMVALVRELQPEILLNDRISALQNVQARDSADFWTPEQVRVDCWPRDPETGELRTWEACHTFSGSWGYHRDETTWKSPEQLIGLLVDSVACGGNLLMNVGPTARGLFDRRALDALDVYAEWTALNGRSIYGCTMAEPEFRAPAGTQLTQSEDGKRLYVHLRSYPFGGLRFSSLAPERVDYAQFLSDGSEVRFRAREPEDGGAPVTELLLPVVPPAGRLPVIEIFLK